MEVQTPDFGLVLDVLSLGILFLLIYLSLDSLWKVEQIAKQRKEKRWKEIDNIHTMFEKEIQREEAIFHQSPFL